MRTIFTPQDHRRIREATSAVESRTGTKIATVITRQSGRYVAYTVAWSALGAIIAGIVLAIFRPAMGARSVLLDEISIFAILLVFLEAFPLRFAIVSKRVKYGNARNLAHREFAAHAMSAGEDQKRILVFVSMGERYVEIIADHATHERVADGSWKRIVDDIIAKVSGGRLADGIVSAIEACGAILPGKTETSTGEHAEPTSL
jgi:putative membrane protein